MTWDIRADEVETHAAQNGWSEHLPTALSEFRHQAETCRYLAQEVRDSRD